MSGPNSWRELRRETLLDYRVFSVERSVAESPIDGSVHDFYRVLSRDWAQIVPVTADDEIVMVRQYRHGSSSIVLEIPGGIVDDGEDPADAAMRECLEETGYRAPSVERMNAVNPNPAFHAHRLHSFLARGVEQVGEIQNTGTEQTTVELVPIADLARRLRTAEIDHALVATTLWQFLHDHC